MIILSPRGIPLIDAGALAAAARQRWGDAVSVHVRERGGEAVVDLDVRPEDAPSFLLVLSADGTSITVDGTDEQDLETAAWVRSLLPVDFPRVVLFDDHDVWHADLLPGATAESIHTGRVTHDDPDWAAGDPDFG